jgi:hypothetical protein
MRVRSHRISRALLLAGLLPAALACTARESAPAATAPAPVLASYVLLSAVDGATFPQARVILDSATADCPELESGGDTVPTHPRTNPHRFPVRVCEARLPWDREFRVAGAETPLPVARRSPRRVVVVGDTGCETKDCGDRPASPFATLASRAAGLDPPPDLVLHAGDFNYRGSGSHVRFDGTDLEVYDAGDDAPEDPHCQLEGRYASLNAGYSPAPDSWESWRLDFFEPARDLLAVAPWVVTRGNHELCSRAGPGWFYFLDPGTGEDELACPDQGGDTPPEDGAWPHLANAPPYVLGLGDLRIAVLDSANACDGFAPGPTTDLYTAQLREIGSWISGRPPAQSETPPGSPQVETWLLTHRPIWGVQRENGKLDELSRTLQQASHRARADGGGPLDRFGLLISGHLHIFQSLTFTGGERPPQVVAGNGGVALWGKPTGVFSATVDGRPVAGLAVLEHGFLDISRDPSGNGWRGRLLGTSGVLATCDPDRLPEPLCAPYEPDAGAAEGSAKGSGETS